MKKNRSDEPAGPGDGRGAKSGKIVFWAWGEYADMAQYAVRTYNAAYNENITCEVVDMTAEQISAALENGDELPDVLLASDSDVRAYAQKHSEKFVDLGQYVNAGDFLPFAENNVTASGGVYGYPFSSDTIALYYREDIAGEVGYDLSSPVSWQDFVSMGEEIKNNYGGMYLLAPSDELPEILMRSTGVLYYTYSGGGTSNGSRELLDLMSDLSAKELICPREVAPDMSAILGMMSNDGVFAVIGKPEWFTAIKNAGLPGSWRVSYLPKSFPFENNVSTGGYAWMAANKDDGTDRSYITEILAQFCSPECAVKFAADYDVVPVKNDAIDAMGEVDNDGCFDGSRVMQFLAELGRDMPVIYYGKNTDAITEKLDEAVDGVLSGATTAEGAYLTFLREFDKLTGSGEKTLERIEIETPPYKTTYYENQRFDAAGMKVLAYYTDGSVAEVVSGYTCVPSVLTLGVTHVTVAYTSYGRTETAEVAVKVEPRKLLYITVTSNFPSYCYGMEISPDDFTVTAHYDIGTVEVLKSGLSYKPAVFNVLGEMKIEVTYDENGVIAKQNITVQVVKKLERIVITQLPDKLSYNDRERLLIEGLTVKADYYGGIFEILQYSQYSLSSEFANFEDNKQTNTITVSYSEGGITKTTTFEIYKKTGEDILDCNVEQDFGVCGSGSVNQALGVLKYAYDDFAGGDPSMPVCITRVYCNIEAGKPEIGAGWRLNVQQELREEDGKWVYTDKTGRRYKIQGGFKEESGRSSLRNEELGLDLFVQSDNVVTLKDRNNNILLFTKINGIYRLTAMCAYPSTPENRIDSLSIDIEYDAVGMVTKVAAGRKIDGIRPKVNFTYVNGKLSELVFNKYGSDTTVAKYNYINGNLQSVTRLNGNISAAYSAKTEFIYNAQSFAVYDCASLDKSGNKKSLEYKFDAKHRVNNISVGYGQSDRDSTSISYIGEIASADPENTDVQMSVQYKHNDTVSVASFSSLGLVSQYSYEIEGENYAKPKRVLGAQSRGFDCMALANAWSDTLDVFHDDFEDNKTGWFVGELDTDKAICGAYSLKGYGIFKTFSFTKENLPQESTVYLSMWVMGESPRILVSYRDDEQYILEAGLCTGMGDKWQYTALCLGKYKSGNNVVVMVAGCEAYIDDVRIIRLPYNTPNDIPDNVYNVNGNVTTEYNYNAVSGEIMHTDYAYNDGWQMTSQTEFDSAGGVKNKAEYTYAGGFPSKQKIYGKSGEYTEENYTYTNGVVASVTDADNVKVTYGYGVNSENTSVAGGVNSPTVTVNTDYYNDSNAVKKVSSGAGANDFTYDTAGRVKTLKNNSGDTYTYDHDTFGNTSKVKIGNVPLVSAEYGSRTLNKLTYANGDSESYGYDSKYRLVSVTENDNAEPSVTISYSDNAQNTVTVTNEGGVEYKSENVNKGGATGAYWVTRPNESWCLGVKGQAAQGVGNITTTEYYNRSVIQPFERCTVKTDANGQICDVQRTFHGADCTYTYDDNHRLTQKMFMYPNKPSVQFYNEYEYKSIKGEQTSNLIQNETFIISGYDDETYDYYYYPNGNIERVHVNGEVKYMYYYDDLNRLISVHDYNTNMYYNYTYDAGGNILTRKTLASGITHIKTDNYLYNATWHDRLDSYNGVSIEYDESGNPLNYMGKIMTWQGRKATSIDGVTMQYDYNGKRLCKGDKKYFWQGDVLKYEYDNNGYIYYYHDESGVCGMCVNDTEYYFRKNIFGDVVGIYDVEGNMLCKYTYDAWGKHTITDAQGKTVTAENIGNKNPYRYRGYYYDTEFGLYYLQSRYYDPETGRFINADDVSYLDPQTIGGLNLFSYCGNNPVMNIDPIGYAWWSWLISGLQVLGGIALCFVPGAQGVGAGLIVGGTLGLISNVVSPAIAQVIGGASSIANGWGAFSTGLSILGLGIPGLIGGIALMLIGGVTMAFGANEVVAAVTGTNYIQQWTGMSDSAYGWTYFGLNLASSVGQIVGNGFRLYKTRTPRISRTGEISGYRYFDKFGNPFFDFDYPHINVSYNHWHGWGGPGLQGRTKGHWGFFRLIWWLLIGR